ncbi:hypothetical protein ACHAXS_004440, partial [Conticribra weissflogii]
DVLFGRGKIAFNHEGNSRFRSIVESRIDEYSVAHVKKKRLIAIEIIEMIESLDPPGRFLLECPKGSSGGKNAVDYWVPADREKAISKVCHRLREKRKETKSSAAGMVGGDCSLKIKKSGLGSQAQKEAEKCTDNADHNKMTSSDARDQTKETISRASPRLGHRVSNSDNESCLSPINSREGTILNSDSASRPTAPQSVKFLGGIDAKDDILKSSPLSEFNSINDEDHGTNSEASFRNTTSMSLREWIAKEINAGDRSIIQNESKYLPYSDNANPQSIQTRITIASSKRYIKNALNIAHSLACQICNGEQALESNYRRRNSDFLPQPGYDWTNRIVVHVQTNQNAHSSSDFEPRLLSEGDEAFVNHRHGECWGGYSPKSPSTPQQEDSQQSSIPCKAQILPPLESDDDKYDANSTTMRIYRLGVVFYELFSGGLRPTSAAGWTIHGHGLSNRIDSTIGFSTQLTVSSREETMREINQRWRKKGRSFQTTVIPCQELSIESLRMNGIPFALCDLIENMLDNVNGDIMGDESYRRMTDVRNDLKLMIENPERFLLNIDVEKICKTGLELKDTIYGQQKELCLLKNWYKRSNSRSDGFAIIAGPSGIGKTVLANQFEEFVSSEEGIFVTGKFDQLQQATPFHAIASAFNEYCNVLLSDGGSSRSIAVASALRESLGRDASCLGKVIPNLSMIFGDFEDDEELLNCVNAQRRLQYLLCRFVEVISSSSSNPIVLFLDDIQWADPASITVIHHLLVASRFSRFLFIGSCRDDEMNQGHPIWNMIASVQSLGVNATMIKLQLFDKETVNTAVSDMLSLSPRLTWPLSDIVYHKTKGNPMFFSRLMISLSKERLLHFSLSRRRWVWDEEKIQSRKIPDDVAEFLTNSISQLSPEIQAALCTLSCFGASANISAVKVLEDDLGLQLQNSLDAAVADGFLDKMNGKYQFCHDRVQEAAYNMLSREDRASRHSSYGLALCRHTLENINDDAMLFTAIDQVNRGGPTFVSGSDQGSLLAFLNLQAGNKAMAMSDFTSALAFFDHGILFLDQNHWRDNYEFSLELFDNAVKSFNDKLTVIYHAVSALCDASSLDEAIEKGVWVLSMLGEDLFQPSSRSETLSLIEKTRCLVQSYPEEILLNYNLMTDASKIMAMKFLSRLEISLVMGRRGVIPIVTSKMVELSLAYGLTPMSAIGFAYFGSMLASIGYINEGYRYVKLSKDLVHRFGSKEVAGEVIAIATQTIGYVEPMQTTLEFHLQGHTSALEAGDIRNASLNFNLYCNYLFYSGRNLIQVKTKCEEACLFMKQHKMLAFLLNAKPFFLTITKLIDRDETAAPFGFHGPKEDFLISSNPSAAMIFHFNKMYISFMYRDFDGMTTAAEKYFGYKLDVWTLLNIAAAQTFISGLVSFWIYRRTSDCKWFERGNRSKLAMKHWAESSQWNFLQ